jgi:elongation factor 1 alpha-like protein
VPDSGKKVAPKREKKADDGSTSEDLAADTSALSLEGVVSSPKHKRSNVVEEYEKSNMKKSLSFVVVGHVDHGKSTLMGRLLYELKIVSENAVRKLQRDSDKIGKGSFALAWVMDATSDERTRGVTVDTATRFFETDKTKFTILDAPGHRDFIPNMIAGAAQADFAVLVVDAGPNAFESGLRGQTREHALLARSAGVQRLVVAVNKMDRAGWDEARFNEIRQQTGAFLAAAGFPTSDVSFVPVAGLTGENLTTPPGDGKAAWYKGPTLLAELDGTRPASRRVDAPLRMTVSEIGRGGAGSSSVSVTGRIEAGNVQPGDAVLVQPSGRRATVRALLGADDDAAAEWAVAGQTVTLRLAGFSADDSGGAAGGDEDLAQLVRPGSVVCAVDAPARNLRAFRAKVLALEHVLPQAVEVHRGRLQAAGRVAALVVELDKVTGQPKEAAAGGEKGRRKKGRPRVLQPGTVALVDVVLAEAMPLEAGNRVVLRAEGVSIAAGLVEQEVEAEGL